LPALANCSATPVTPSGTSPVTTNLTIATTQRTSAPPGGSPRPYGPAGGALRHGLWILWAFLLLGITGWAARQKTFRWSFAALGVLALWLLSFAACGSGGTGYVNPTGTPAGTYTVTVTGASAGLKQTANITLIVQ
jgi:hypothetical protein